MPMGNLYVINASRSHQAIPLFLTQKSGDVITAYRKTRLEVPSGGQIVIGDEFDEAHKVALVNHIERFGGVDISMTHHTPQGFSGLAYRWEKPASESDIERSHEVDMTRRAKLSAREFTRSAKAFDGQIRQTRGIKPSAVITETVIEEVAPRGETMPSGGIRSEIIGDPQGGDFDIAV